MKPDGFEELGVDKRRSELKITISNIELTLNVRYFIGKGMGYCSLLLADARGKSIGGCIKAAVARAFIGKVAFIFLSELEDGKKLITVPALSETKRCNVNVDLSGFVINTYNHRDFKRKEEEVCKEHMRVMEGKRIRYDRDSLCKSILELPEKGLEILRSYR